MVIVFSTDLHLYGQFILLTEKPAVTFGDLFISQWEIQHFLYLVMWWVILVPRQQYKIAFCHVFTHCVATCAKSSSPDNLK